MGRGELGVRVRGVHIEDNLKSETMFLKDQVVAEQQEKNTLEEALTQEINALQEKLGERNKCYEGEGGKRRGGGGVGRVYIKDNLKSEIMFLKDQVVAEPQEKNTLEEALTQEINALQEKLGERNKCYQG